MLPEIYFGGIIAIDVDYGLYDPSELDVIDKKVGLILSKVKEGRSARLALEQLRARIARQNYPRINNHDEFDVLMSKLRYGPSDNNQLSSERVSISVFLSLDEYLSPQYIQDLIKSQKAVNEAVVCLQNQPVNMKNLRRLLNNLKTENLDWAKLLNDEVQKLQSKEARIVPLTSRLGPSPLVQSHNLSLTSTNYDERAPKRPKYDHGSLQYVANGNHFRWISTVGDNTCSSSIVESTKSFLRMKEDCPLAATLLAISTIWGGHGIPKMIFTRASEPRKRWNSQGEVEKIELESTIRLDVSQTTAAIDYLCSSNLTNIESGKDGYERISVCPSLQDCLAQHFQNWDDMKVKALMLTCHSFPGDKDIEPFWHTALGKLLLRPLQSVAVLIPEMLQKKSLSNQQMHVIIEALLESSNFPGPSTDTDWRFQAVDLADKLLLSSPDESLLVSAAIRRKALSRLVHQKIYEEPSYLLKRSATSPKSNFLQWKLRLSKAQDRLFDDDYVGAEHMISNYESFYSKSSTLEQHLGKDIRFQRARFIYLAGRFSDAQTLFKRELDALNENEKLHDDLICYLASVRCELDTPERSISLMISTLTEQTGGSRLHVSLAEGLLHLGMKSCIFGPPPFMDKTAQDCFSQAKNICEKALEKASKSNKVHYLRVKTIAARICFLEAFYGGGDLAQAYHEWLEVAKAVDNCGWKPGFMQAVTNLTTAIIQSRLSEKIQPECDMEAAIALLEKVGPRHLIVGLGTIWLNFIRALLPSNRSDVVAGLRGKI